MQPGFDEVGHAAHAVQIVAREEGEPVLARQTLAGLHLVPDWMETGVAESWRRGRGNSHWYLQVRVAQTDWSV